MRDDRVLPQTRWLDAVIAPFLVVAFALLYYFPDDTRHWFAGAYFFVRVARAEEA